MHRLAAAIAAYGVHQRIHTPKFAKRLLDELAETRGVREINSAGEQMVGRVCDVLERLKNAVRRTIHQDSLCAGLLKEMRGGRAEIARRTRDDRDFVFQ